MRQGEQDDSAPAGAFLPLTGMRVVDFTRLVAGPYSAMTLAELGADVIKVEAPGGGDEARSWGPPFIRGSSAHFHALNRGKRSIELDLTQEAGRSAAWELIAEADIVLESFRPGVAERLGIGAGAVLERFPRMIYASVSAFSSQGPRADEAGTALTIEAESGLMHVTGHPGEEPVRSGVAMVDIAAGLSLVNGVLAALLELERTGRGRALEVSLFGTALSALGAVLSGATAGGPVPRGWGSAHPSIVPYRAVAAADGYVVIGAVNDAMFARLADALTLDPALCGGAWLTNEGRVADRAEVDAAVAAAVRTQTVDDVVDRMRRHRVVAAKVRTPEEAARSPEAQATGQILEEDGVLFARSPLSMNGTRALPPAPGKPETGRLR